MHRFRGELCVVISGLSSCISMARLEEAKDVIDVAKKEDGHELISVSMSVKWRRLLHGVTSFL